MSFLRPLLMIAVIVAACVLSTTYSPHATGTNDDPFQPLFKHVEPGVLMAPAHGEEEHAEDDHGSPLFAVPMPGFLSFLDWNADPHDGVHLALYNLQIFQIAAILLIFIAFTGVPTYLRTGRGDAFTRFLAGACLFVRDGMMAPYMDARTTQRFLPVFLALFFFIAFMNLLGLVPGSATATASIFVTGALALITFGMMLGCGMAEQGVVAFWKNLVPHVPGWLWPLMFVVEVIGLVVKPVALTIRLFANLTGGHLVVLSFIGLIFFFAGVGHSSVGWAISPVAVGFGVFIMIIEGFVALVQAFIFTQLSIIFVSASLHPEH